MRRRVGVNRGASQERRRKNASDDAVGNCISVAFSYERGRKKTSPAVMRGEAGMRLKIDFASG
jgi:hypothetical protein